MASKEKHKQRSCRSFRVQTSQLGYFEHTRIYKVTQVQQKKSIFTRFTALLAAAVGHEKRDTK